MATKREERSTARGMEREDVVHNTRDYYSAVENKGTPSAATGVGLGTVTLERSEPDTEADVTAFFMGWSQNHGADRPTEQKPSHKCVRHI